MIAMPDGATETVTGAPDGSVHTTISGTGSGNGATDAVAGAPDGGLHATGSGTGSGNSDGSQLH